MKNKLIALLLVAVMLIAIPLSASADWFSEYSGVPEENIGSTAINSVDFGSSKNKIREKWTPTRKGSDSEGIYNPEFKYILDGQDVVMNMVGNQGLASDGSVDTWQYIGIEMKLDNCDGFCGMVLNYDIEKAPTAPTNNTSDDRKITPVIAASTPDGVFAYNTGLGFTILKGSKSVIRTYVRCKNAEGLDDAIFFDVDTGVDLTGGYHLYKVYRDDDYNAYSVVLDEKTLISTILISADGTKVELMDANGAIKATTDKPALNLTGNIMILTLGEATKTLIFHDECTTFIEDFPIAAAWLAEHTTAAPETTKKPVTTKKPEETKAPVTSSATPETTVAPETTKEEKSGCGSVAAIGVAVIVTVLGSAVLSKKH